ncbi:hypothetical protein ACTFIZ_011350 [Dictyostelium cf. discoideum]
MSFLNKSNNIPNYIQKEIIKLICYQCNRVNKKLCEFDLYEEEEIKYKSINKTILSICLTSWFWFKTCSTYMNVIINFNKSIDIINNYNNNYYFNNIYYNNMINNNNNNNNNKYSMLKIENLTTLVLESSIIKSMNFIERLNKFLNLQVIKTNLKKILIHINYSNNNSQNNQLISMIGKIDFPFIRISNFEFDVSITSMTTSFILPINIKKIKSIGVLKNYSPSMIISNLRNLSFKEIYICNYNNKFPFKELSIMNKLSSVQYYDTHKTSIKIDDLYYILKSSPNLQLLSFYICIDDLIYQLSCPKHKPKSCQCNNNNSLSTTANTSTTTSFTSTSTSTSTTTATTTTTTTTNNEFSFYYYWRMVCKLIKNHKKLKSLFIYSLCKNGENCGLNYLNKLKMSNHFVNQFGGMISKNKSIKKLNLDGFNSPDLLKRIITNNNTINSIQFQFPNNGNNILSNNQKLEYINIFDKLLNSNNNNDVNDNDNGSGSQQHSIKKFKLIENISNQVDSKVKTEKVLFSFEK